MDWASILRLKKTRQIASVFHVAAAAAAIDFPIIVLRMICCEQSSLLSGSEFAHDLPQYAIIYSISLRPSFTAFRNDPNSISLCEQQHSYAAPNGN